VFTGSGRALRTLYGAWRLWAAVALTPPGGFVKEKQTYTVELEPAKMEFLEQMAEAHGLPDAGKAIRCLIDYARENAQAREAIFGEVRCVDCG
jgi:hypothetical protein